jgi:hypothetical protein
MEEGKILVPLLAEWQREEMELLMRERVEAEQAGKLH